MNGSKFYIHKCKFSNCKPVFSVFLKEIENYLNVISGSTNMKAIRTIRICTASCETISWDLMALYVIFLN